jgi:hypothetical protein
MPQFGYLVEDQEDEGEQCSLKPHFSFFSKFPLMKEVGYC